MNRISQMGMSYSLTCVSEDPKREEKKMELEKKKKKHIQQNNSSFFFFKFDETYWLPHSRDREKPKNDKCRENYT